MSRAQEHSYVLARIAMAVLLLVQCTAQAASDQKPLVSRITQDFNTSLYTVSIKNGAPLVVDLAGSLVWFALCLPVFAAFGDTPVYLPNYNPSGPFDYTKRIQQTPFLTNPRTPGYYLPVKGISVSWRGPSVPVSLPAGALDLDVRTGRGGVVLSTVTPNAVMRPDVFRAFAKAFDTVVVRDSGGRMARGAPGHRRFELCYGGAGGTSFTFPMMKWTGIDAPAITLQLGAGATGNWTILNSNYLREWSCVGVVEMGPEGMPVDGEPAVVLGGVQLENVLLVFDLDKRTLGFSRLLEWDLTSCYSATMFRYKLPTTQP
uniref:Xylanase inhibitor C-terminal domain-containing protein n=1 Tax=Oryza brachyantha TaxID=4533 RepID=J3L7N9_ORYBR